MLIEEFEKLTTVQKTRGYLGCSIIGHPCDRYIWLQKYGDLTLEIPFRKQRIFERGMIEESRIFSLLSKVDRWTIEKIQHPVQKGILKGNIDAIIGYEDGTRYILEIKTMNDEAFKELRKHGVQKSQFGYWVQCQMYLFLSDDIKKALLLAINKNDESLYEEVIDLDPSVGETFMAKAERLHEQKEMPLGLMAFEKKPLSCFGCSFERFCYGQEQMKKEEPVDPIDLSR